MQARRASRELALILFSQFDKLITSYTAKDFNEILLKSVRILTNNASDDLQLTVGALIDTKQYLDEYQADHEINSSKPIESNIEAVPIPMTDDMMTKIDNLLEISEKALYALEIAEFATLEAQSDVKNYAIQIAESFKTNYEAVDKIIQENATGWNIDRLVKVDKDILRIAVLELLFIKEVPHKVVVDEAVELAKKYSTEDSASFVNGILAKVITDNGIA